MMGQGDKFHNEHDWSGDYYRLLEITRQQWCDRVLDILWTRLEHCHRQKSVIIHAYSAAADSELHEQNRTSTTEKLQDD